MKSFTDLEQSKKLAKILPLKSADMVEEWKDIEGYEGLYMVSNFGRVVSLQGRNPRVMNYFPDGTSKEFESATKAGKELKISSNRFNKDGYDEKLGLRWAVS